MHGNSTLKASVLAALVWDPSIEAAHIAKPQVSVPDVTDAITHAMHRSWMFDPDDIDVSATEESVRLSGTVHTPHDEFIAGATAWATPGVTEVHNDIRVV